MRHSTDPGKAVVMVAMTNKVLITVKLAFEHSIKQDVKDYLFLIDRNVHVRDTGFRGVFIIETTKDPIYIADVLMNSPIPGSALPSVVPIIHEGYYKDLGDIVNIVIKNLRADCSSIIVKCRLRNSPISDDACERAIINALRNSGLRASFKGEGDCAVVVEGLNDWVGIYVGPRAHVRI